MYALGPFSRKQSLYTCMGPWGRCLQVYQCYSLLGSTLLVHFWYTSVFVFIAKPVPRVKGVETTPPSTSARDALLAGAGVSVIGQTKRSPYLSRQVGAGYYDNYTVK